MSRQAWHMTRRRFASVVAAVFSLAMIVSGPALADALDTYKAQGLVGEGRNGYIGFVEPPTPAVKQVVNEVNLKRRAFYQQIAKKNNASLSDIERVAGANRIKATPSGEYVESADGSWVKKP